MTKIIRNNKETITHGKSVSKKIADFFASGDCFYHEDRYTMMSWIEKANKPHKCDVHLCPLYHLYVKNKFLTISAKLLLYEESKKVLENIFPSDIVIYILKNVSRIK
jgi:hypothetical protein